MTSEEKLWYNCAVMASYRKRIADDILEYKLSAMGAVLVEGAKWCGKTTTCEQHAKSVLYMADPATRNQNMKRAELDIYSLLSGAKPRLIDEWQDAPKLWDAIRFAVDHGDEGSGQFILTGSAVPPRADEISHTGTGRFARIKMRPMSLWESGESSGKVSLGELFGGNGSATASGINLALDDLAFVCCRGGWPQSVGRKGERALITAREYYEGVVESDITRADEIPRAPDRVRRLMRSCARLQGTQSNLAAIRKDLQANDVRSLNEDTIHSYVTALKKIFVIEDLPAWNPDLRTKGSIRTTDTRYFVDPSIAAAALGVGPGNLVNDIRSFGFFFEALAIRDLRVYMDALRGRVERYHDKTGLECDAVLHLSNGEYGLVEIKLGGETLTNEGIVTLHKLNGLIKAKGMKEPKFMMVLTGTGSFAHKENGVFVCPLSALKQ